MGQYTLRKPAGETRWHVYFVTRDGKRFRKSTKQEDKRRAAFVADEWYRKLADPTYQAAHATTIAEASGRLKESLVDAGRSPETLKFYSVKLSHVARIMGADTVLGRIDAACVDQFIRDRKKEGAKAYTISKELTALRQLLRLARRRGEFDKELSQVMPLKFATGYKPKTRRLTQADVWALLAELPESAARYLAFVCATTARDSAVYRALGRHRTPEGIEVYDFKTKGSRRTVPMNSVVQAFADYAFTGVSPDAAVASSTSSVRHAFQRAAARLSLPSFSGNDIRRSVAHWLLERGVPRSEAASFLGHANTKMLDEVYGKLDHKELGESINRSLRLAQKGAESSLDESWINVAKSGESGGSVDNVDASNTGEKACAGRESNPRHGDFQPPLVSRDCAEKADKPTESLDESWKVKNSRHFCSRTTRQYIRGQLAKAVRSAYLGDEQATLASMLRVGRAVGALSRVRLAALKAVAS